MEIFIQFSEYLCIMNKTLRQRAVLDVLKHGSIASQEDLQRLLRKRGFKVGQATLSRHSRFESKQDFARIFPTPGRQRVGRGAASSITTGARVCAGYSIGSEPVGDQDHCR